MKKNISRLTACIEKAHKQNRLALVPYLTAGIPSRVSFWNSIEELAASGADIIEIGVPFSDPVADGPTVAEASQKALEDGIDLDYIFEGLRQRRAALGETCIVLMGYANPFLQYAWEKKTRDREDTDALDHIAAQTRDSLCSLADALAAAGVDGLIVPDLPLEERGTWLTPLQSKGIDLIPLVGLNTPVERMKAYAETASGFVYMVSVLGITGGRQQHTPAMEDMVRRARQAFSLPLALGFGLRTPDQLDGIPKDCLPDAVVFGSALIRHLQCHGTAKDFMAPWAAGR